MKVIQADFTPSAGWLHANYDNFNAKDESRRTHQILILLTIS